MRRHLFIAFLGLWIAIVPFLFYYGSTQKAILIASGIAVSILSLFSLRDKPQI